MTKDKIELLAYKIMEQFNGDKAQAMRALGITSDAFFTLGQHKKAEQAQKVLDYVRANY